MPQLVDLGGRTFAVELEGDARPGRRRRPAAAARPRGRPARRARRRALLPPRAQLLEPVRVAPLSAAPLRIEAPNAA
ncbi:hypothetical protein NKH77_00945 [Streptomyces sp. M19]